jgi:hypothetical protein
MPVEIGEIGVSIAVDPIGGDNGPGPAAGLTPAVREDLIRQCVEEVLRVLKRLEER